MSIENRMTVTEIQRFCMHDGPGVRTVVFLKGCPLQCAWCHNPETQRGKRELLFSPGKCIGCGACVAGCSQGVHLLRETHTLKRSLCTACGACAALCPTGALSLCGREMTTEEILSVVEKDRAFYGERGGVTLSGGEPLAQGENAVALLKACRERGLSTAVETCGYVSPETVRAAAPFVDLFLWDIKDTDSMRHKKYTGVSNELILGNLALANGLGARIRLRCILVNRVNTEERHYAAVAELAKGIRFLEGVEWLPYHPWGGAKAVLLGNGDNGRKDWIPEQGVLDRAREFLREQGILPPSVASEQKASPCPAP